MPRLLLVDDNPSIHKIAETLLASTDVELSCVDSAEKALELINGGERFDVALVDTVLTGMDGWDLLDRMRQNPRTQRIPIALMAGVLDTVDPERLSRASIQGFIKKPVELRDLSDRVRRLLEVPVPLAELPPDAEQEAAVSPVEFSPFSTLPATKLTELPEMRPRTGGMPLQVEAMAGVGTAAEPEASMGSMKMEEDDLLLLTPEDLFPEEPSAEAAPLEAVLPVAGEEPLSIDEELPLDLEELDIESLRGMVMEPSGAPEIEPIVPISGLPERTPLTDWGTETPELPDLGAALEIPLEAPEEPSAAHGEPAQELAPAAPQEELGAVIAEEEWTPPQPPEAPLSEAEFEGPLDLDLTPLPSLEVEEPVPAPEPAQEEGHAVESAPAAPLAAALVAPASPEAPAESLPSAPLPEAVPGDQGTLAKQLLAAIAADPASLDVLAKAVVARLGDQALREVAWEVMPDLAERMGRKAGL